MEKRPLSLTIIAWVLIVLSLLALVGLFAMGAMGSNPQVAKAMQQTHVPPLVQQAWSVLGVIVDLIVAYGILKGQPWSRVLYVVFGAISLVVGFFMTPVKAALVLSLVMLVVIGAFLFTDKANDWFSARGLMLRREGEAPRG